MKWLQRNPWLWLVALFSFSLLPWAIFFYLAAKHPVQRLPVMESPSTGQKP